MTIFGTKRGGSGFPENISAAGFRCIAFCVMAMIVAGLSCKTSRPTQPETAIAEKPLTMSLFQWKTPEDAAKWKCRSQASLRLADWPDKAPGKCGRFQVREYQPGKEGWPAMMLEADKMPRSDLRGVEKVELEIYSSNYQTVSFLARSADGRKKRYALKLRPGRSTVTIPGTLFDVVNSRNISEIHFYCSHPQSDMTFYIGEGKLRFRDFAEALAELKKSAAEFVDDFGSPGSGDSEWRCLPESARRGIKAEMIALDDDIRALDKRWDELKTAPSSSTLDILESAENRKKNLEAWATMARFLEADDNKALSWGWTSGMEKIHQERHVFTFSPRKEYTAEIARNETEGIQLAMVPRRELNNLRVSLEKPLIGPDASILAADNIEIAPVGYVDCPRPDYSVERTGLWPDPILLYADKMSLAPWKWQSYWVDIRAPKNQKPGLYSGHLLITADDMPPVRVPLSVRVRNFILPDGAPLPIVTSLGNTDLGPTFPVGDEARAKYREACRGMFLAHRLNPDEFRPDLKGTPNIKEIRRNLEAGTKIFNLAYIRESKNCDEIAMGKYDKLAEKIKHIESAAQACRDAGLLDRAYIYAFDEIESAQFPIMRRSLAAVKEKVPDVKILSTATDYTFGLKSGTEGLVDIWVPLLPYYEWFSDEAAAARRRGAQVWLYFASNPNAPYPNAHIEDPSIGTRLLMGCMLHKLKPEGILYYRLCRWMEETKNAQGGWLPSKLRKHPIAGAPLTNWSGQSWHDNNGDGNFGYPGTKGPIPSLRLKNMRDGLEDYAYLKLLENAAADSAAMSPEWRAKAKSALNISPDIVASAADYTKDHARLLKYRFEIAGLLEEHNNVMGDR